MKAFIEEQEWEKRRAANRAKLRRARHRRLEAALCALADYQGELQDEANRDSRDLHNGSGAAFDYAISDVCTILRRFADGEVP